MLALTLPWPDHDLHPNARIIWQVKQGAIRTAREYAKYATQATETAMQAFSGSMTVEYTFCPPSRAHRDLDNLVANMKPALDGIMDALQTNDNQIVKVSAVWGDVVKHGQVDVVINALSEVDSLRDELNKYQWIAVSERVPGPYEYVLAWGEDTHWTASISNGIWHDDTAGYNIDVTHWMPLPKPPAGEVQL